MISEANININIKTATNEELITELLVLEDYPMYKEIYKAIQIELNKRENQVINQTIEQKQQKPITTSNQSFIHFYGRPDRHHIDGKPF